GEFAKRIETAAHQGHAAGIIKVLPENFVEDFGQLGSFRVPSGGLKLRDGEFDANGARVCMRKNLLGRADLEASPYRARASRRHGYADSQPRLLCNERNGE